MRLFKLNYMSLQIGQYIKYALGEVNAPLLNAKVKGRVSPVVSPDDDGTHMPYIWYYSDGFTPSNTKDGEYEDTCSVSIEVVLQFTLWSQILR